jgi:hypothetical protein
MSCLQLLKRITSMRRHFEIFEIQEASQLEESV